MTELMTAYMICDIAHTAKGQTRADRVTPYRQHPENVSDYVLDWYLKRITPLKVGDLKIARCAAFLHDVLEDTKLTADDLRRWEIGEDIIHVVELLTKENSPEEPESKLYYSRIAENRIALTVKCADRCSNLDDAFIEVTHSTQLKRWKRYYERTITDVYPIYSEHPKMLAELQKRVYKIQRRLDPQEATT